MEKRRLWIAAISLALLSSVLTLLVATTSSPLYATNFWTDTNIFLTIGRGIANGMAPYRDLVDQKGPLIFLIYALAALITENSFFGAFLLEIVSMTAFTLISWRIASLYGEGKLTLAAIPLTALITVCCTAFTQGGSAEEFNLPALALALYVTLRRMKKEGGCVHAWKLHAAFGACMGWVFVIKYTDCGLFFGLGLCLALFVLCTGGVKAVVRMILEMLAGFLAIVLPIVLYLAVSGALWDCLDTYFIQNIFVYSGTPMSFTGHIYNALAYLRTQSAINPAVALLAFAGVAFVSLHALVRREKGCIFHAAAAPMAAGLLLLFCYWGEIAHPYYALAFAALVPLGLVPLGWLAPRIKKSAWIPVGAALLLTAILPQQLCMAVPLQQVKKEEMPQTAFAQIMREEENPTLLDISSLDHGFYLAADILPDCRYFCVLNANAKAQQEEIAEYLESAKTQFVVSRYTDPGERYERIAEASGVFDLNSPQTYYLYKRIE